MINKLGGVRQLGMVVKDADATMQCLTKTLGVGPFYVVRDFVPEDFYFRGERSEPPVMTLCFAQAGSLQIELIEQKNDAPSAYREFLDAGREGSQHIAVWFADSAQYSTARQELLDSGLEIIHENGARAVARFAYFSTAIPGGLMLEIAEAWTPQVRHMFDLVASASQDWNGADPIRAFV